MPRLKVKLSLGKNALVSCLAKYLRPKKVIDEHFVNYNPKKRCNNLLVLRLDVVGGGDVREVQRLIVRSDDVMNGDDHVEMYGHPRFFTVTQEGPKEMFFEPVVDDEAEEVVNNNDELPPEVVQLLSLNRQLNDDDYDNIRGVVEFDDDNLPAPENIPQEETTTTIIDYSEWGHTGLCHRRMAGIPDAAPTITNLNNNQPSLVELFEHLFPSDFLKDVVLTQINDNIEQGTREVTYGELLRWIGCWFLMATITGPQRHEYWRNSEPTMFAGAPFRLNKIMTGNRFNVILSAIEYTNDNPPAYKDRFHPIRKLVDAWNNNMKQAFSSSWITCLDESMSVWNNQYTCPGFVVVPRKPHPMGNEYHTIACGMSGVLFQLEMREGKDSPKEKGKPMYSHLGTTVGLLLRLTKCIWGSGRIVVLDSGFCVLKALIELRKRGVFASAVVKKRRYWPMHVKGDEIKQHFEDKEIGFADALPGSLDSTPFHIVAMKDANFVSLFMTTYGTLEPVERMVKKFKVNADKTTERVEYKYTEIFDNYYKTRGAVDNHNAKRHAPISLETTWATKTWMHRVFAFLVAVTEVNCFQVANYFYNKNIDSMLEFRKALSKELINNKYLDGDEAEMTPHELRRSRRNNNGEPHELPSLPKKTKFSRTNIVASVSNYPQFKCNNCNLRVRTYCKCSPGTYRCSKCFVKHYATAGSED